MANLRSGLLITADASGAVKAVRLTKKEVGTLAKTTKDFGKQTKSASDHIEKARASLDKYAKAFAAVGAAGVAAMSAIVKHGAEAAKQIEVMSRLAGVSVETFQVQANAAATVGVEMDKYADIMKDVQDKVGDFLQNGGGPMKDFFDNIAPQVGVTAKQFKELSGPQALQLYVSSLEKANLSNSEMTFYMEAIASDATLLLPLMKNNAKAFKDLGDKAKDAGLYLSQMDVKNLVKLDNTFLQISQSFETMSNIFAAELSPFIQAIADEFLDASINANDFREYIRDAIELAAKGTGYFMDMVHGVKVVSTAVEAFFKTIGIGWGQTIDGARLFVKGVEVRLAEAQLFFVEFWGDIVRFAEDAINEIIEAYNKIPFFSDVEPVKLSEPDTTAHVKKINELKGEYDTIQDGINLGFEQMGEAWAEVGELMMQELPSVEFNKRVQEIFRNVEAESKKIAEAQKETTKEVQKTVEATKLWQPEVKEVGGEFENVFDDVFSNILNNFDGFTKEILSGFGDMISSMARQGVGLSSLFGGGATSPGKGGAAVIGPDAALGQGFLNTALPIAGTAGISYLANSFISNAKNGKWNDALDDALPFFQLGRGLSALGINIGGKPSDKTQTSQINLATGGITQGGFLSGKKFDQTNRDAADIAAQLLSSISQSLSNKVGQDLAGELDFIVGSRDGIRVEFNGEELIRSNEISEVLNTASEKLFELAGVSSEVYTQLQREGETLAESLIRVDSQFDAVNSVADSLGIQFGLLGDQGRIAADSLIQAVGGIDSLIAGANYFYNNFFTEQEKYNDLVGQIDSTFADLGITVPETREEFKNLITGLDLTTEAGQDAYASLIALSPQIDSVFNKQNYWTEQLTQLYEDIFQREPDAAGLAYWFNQLETGSMTIEQVAEAMSNSVEAWVIEANDMKSTAADVGEAFGITDSKASNAASSIHELTESIDALDISAGKSFADDLSREAELSGLDGFDRDLYLLNEWRDNTIESIRDFESRGVAVIGGMDSVDTIYGNRLAELIEQYEEVAEVVEDTTSNVVELIDYEQLRADAVKDLTSAYRLESKELESLINTAGDAASKLREYSNSLLIGDLSALNPQQQFAEARRQFFAARDSGDADAIISAGNAFLTESRDFQGSAGSYASDFELVRSTLNATADLADRQKDGAEKQLAQLEKLVSENIELKKEIKTVKESLDALIEVEKAAANAQLTESEKQTDALGDLVSNSNLKESAA